MQKYSPPVFLVLMLTVCGYSTIFAQQQKPTTIVVTGYIYEDKNSNGVKDSNEPGVNGVAVSDQVNIVTTDKNGFYNLTTQNESRIIFISLPSGYKLKTAFYQTLKNEPANQTADFALEKAAIANEFVFVHASDTHVSEKSLDRMQKLQQKIDSIKPDLMVITGDLVRDALRVPEKEAFDYFTLYKQEIAKIKTTVWSDPGNHDIFGIERQSSLVSKDNPYYGRKMYHYFLGPDYYSFNYNGIHFIALNSLSFEDLYYYGYIDSTQLDWLKKDLAVLDPQTPIVTFQHVPFYSGGLSLMSFELFGGASRSVEEVKGKPRLKHIVSNAGEVMNVLAKYNYPLALGGHYHAQQKFTLAGVQTRFEQAGAVIAPSNVGVLKMPSGIVVYRVKSGSIGEGKFVQLD